MNLEDTLRRSYGDHLDPLDPGPGDLGAARRAGARLRTRRRLAVGASAAVVVAVAVGGSLVGTGRVSLSPAGPSGHWRDLPAAPLEPRADSVSVWTGREVIVLGGETDPCPPGADCATAPGDRRDGAAYDPATDTWRTIPPAPVPVGPGDRLVVADGVVVLRDWLPHGSRWFTYEPDHNRWARIDGVPPGVGDLPSAYGSRVYVTAGDRVATYDVGRFRWSLLPPDPVTPRVTQRRVTATPYGPVVTGYAGGPLVVADRWDGHRWTRLTTGQTGNNDWTWTGRRMLDLQSWYLDVAGRQPPIRPEGGTLDLLSGTWAMLPPDFDRPSSGDGWGVAALGGRRSAAFGRVYDDTTEKVATLPRPDGAPDVGTTATWTDRGLLVFGGSTSGADSHTIDRAWLWTP